MSGLEIAVAVVVVAANVVAIVATGYVLNRWTGDEEDAAGFVVCGALFWPLTALVYVGFLVGKRFVR